MLARCPNPANFPVTRGVGFNAQGPLVLGLSQLPNGPGLRSTAVSAAPSPCSARSFAGRRVVGLICPAHTRRMRSWENSAHRVCPVPGRGVHLSSQPPSLLDLSGWASCNSWHAIVAYQGCGYGRAFLAARREGRPLRPAQRTSAHRPAARRIGAASRYSPQGMLCPSARSKQPTLSLSLSLPAARSLGQRCAQHVCSAFAANATQPRTTSPLGESSVSPTPAHTRRDEFVGRHVVSQRQQSLWRCAGWLRARGPRMRS